MMMSAVLQKKENIKDPLLLRNPVIFQEVYIAWDTKITLK